MFEKVKTLGFSVKINGLFGALRKVDEHFFCLGQVVYQQELLSTEQVFDLVKASYLKNDLDQLLVEFSGFYAFVLLADNFVIAVVDRIRSRPLFFAIENNTVHVSDSSQFLVEQLSDPTINSLSEQELVQAGYVSGRNTLVNQVMQIPTGSYLLAKVNEYSVNTYYRFMPINDKGPAKKVDLLNGLDLAMKQSIRQLISYANNRQIVVPLSGGYDSRAIAIYLKELNYSNIVTFTFGKSSSKEVLISEKVAKALGFEWHFVEYNRALWKRTAKSQSFNDFLHFISSYVSVPNVQVYPAIKSLLEQGIIATDAVIVPGHTGDFSSGGHIPAELVDLPREGQTKCIVDAILSRHYRHKSRLCLDDRLREKLTEQVNYYIDNTPEHLPATSIFEGWEYQERQAKFIVNSNRYYDFFKLDWWMPLWQNDFSAYWEKVPLQYRLNSSLWKYFVEEQYQRISGEKISYGNVNDQYHPKVLRMRKILDYFTDENGLYALVPFTRWLLRKVKYPYANGTLFSYLSAKVIKSQKKLADK